MIIDYTLRISAIKILRKIFRGFYSLIGSDVSDEFLYIYLVNCMKFAARERRRRSTAF